MKIIKSNYFYIILLLSTLVLSLSYGVFVVTTEKERSSEIMVSNILYGVTIFEEGSTTPLSGKTVTVPANSSKEVYVTIYNVNKVESKYALAYQGNVTVKVSDRSSWNPTGGINEYENYVYGKTVKVLITNSNNSSQTVEFNVYGGYSTNSYDNINVPSGYTKVTDIETEVLTGTRTLESIVSSDLNSNDNTRLYGPEANNYIRISSNDSTLYRIVGIYNLNGTNAIKVTPVSYSNVNNLSVINNSNLYETNLFNCIGNDDLNIICTTSSYTNLGYLTEAEVELSEGYLPSNNPSAYLKGNTTVIGQGTSSNPYQIAYTLTYNYNGGSGSVVSKTIIDGETYGELPNVSRTGYTFNGWKVNGSTITSSTTVHATSNQTAIADYTVHTYTVTYNGNTNTGGTTSASSHTYDVAKNLTSNGFVKTYTVTYNYNNATGGNTNATSTSTYTFDGWATSANGNKVYDNEASVINLTSTNNGNYNLYAKWSGGTITLPTPTRTGYTFGGWYKESTLTTLVGSGGSSYTPTANTNLYAKWTANSYTVTFNYNGASGGNSTSSKSVTYDSAYGTLPTPTKTGYTFGGWTGKNLFETGTVSDYTIYPNVNMSISGNNLTGNYIEGNSGWIRNEKHIYPSGTYSLSMGTGVRQIIFPYDGNGNILTNSSINIPGFTYNIYYKGWWCDDSSITTTIPSTVEYWKYGFVFIGSSGSRVTVSDIQIESGSAVTGYEPYNVTSSTIYKSASNTTLTAMWSINSYTLTINPNGGSYNGSTSNTTVTQNYMSDYYLSAPTRSGYTFGGWTISGSGYVGRALGNYPHFESGSNGLSVYNNTGNGTVTFTMQPKTSDNTYGNYQLKVQTSASATPGYGGFYRLTQSAASQSYLHVFVAKLPIGYSFQNQQNLIGNNPSVTWVTPATGTGEFTTYAYITNTGSTGTFGTFGFINVVNNGKGAPVFYVAYSDIINMTSASGSQLYFFGSSNTTLTAKWVKTVEDYDYTGSYATYTPIVNGTYKVELWGAEGGSAYNTDPARGAYTSGNIHLTTSEPLYVYVGAKGGSARNVNYFNYGYQNYTLTGGGATDVRLTSGTWDSFDSLKSRIMVAGGGGGQGGLNSYDGGTPNGGAAGGLVGYQGGSCISNNVTEHPGSTGATQTSGYAFGYVPNSYNSSNSSSMFNNSSGNGYYSGNFYNWVGAGGHSAVSGAGGGSSFISGYSGCNAISSTSTASNIVHTGSPNHYSGKVFTSMTMIDGKGCNWASGSAANCGANQPQPSGTNTVGHSGNGYARITIVSVD